jgi:ubiquinone/menaquinone biosynthesis C-methylase UbiE
VVEATKDQVRAYWSAEPCGSGLAKAQSGSAEFFAQVEAERYRREPFIHSFADFEGWRDRRVLEIGVGLGTDLVQFARAGALVTGVDLTESAVELVSRRLELEGLEAQVLVADAERLPFADGSFDLVYSWGVLHHTPNTEAALAEVVRVLRPEGEARIMLYSRRSWVALGAWLRYALGRGRPWRSFAAVLAEHMESPGTKAYTQSELNRLFAGFEAVRFVRFLTPYDHRVGGPFVWLAGRRFGWFIGAVARASSAR